MVGIGAVLALDFLLGPYGMSLAFWILTGIGALTLLNGITAMMGGCKERMPIIRSSMYLSILQILTVLVAVGILLGSVKKEDKLRLEWSKISEEKRSVIEQKLQCCGYDETEDGIKPCTFKKSCGEFVPTVYKKRVATGTAVAAAGLIGGALGLFGTFCLSRKMAKQEGRAKKKNFTTLQDEARGINKKSRPPRPPK